MVRNIVLAVSSFGILIVLFLGYWVLVDDPTIRRGDADDPTGLPTRDAGEPNDPLQVGNAISVPPGEAVEFSIYDKETGQRRQHLRCARWMPLPDAEDQVRVEQPELTLWMRGGRQVRVTADEGQVLVERLERMPGEAKSGWLRGNVRIVVGARPSPTTQPAEGEPAEGSAAPDTAAPPAEQPIVVALERLEFDLERGAFRSDEVVEVTSPEFLVTARGLDLLWNAADNVLESLRIPAGGEMTLLTAAGLFSGPESTEGESTAAQPAEPAVPSPTGSAAAAEPPLSYTCTLDGGVVAEQHSGEDVVARLRAPEVTLRFDVGRGMGRFGRTENTETAAPGAAAAATEQTTVPQANAPGDAPRGRLVVRWQGQLALLPAEPLPPEARGRRRFEAHGGEVVIEHLDGVIHCGRLEYYDDTQQVWLYPQADGPIEFALGKDLAASASSVYIDQRTRIIKLIDDVRLVALDPEGRRPPQSLAARLWAELYLAPEDAPRQRESTSASERQNGDLAGVGVGALEAAVFVGAAEVTIGGERLAADRIEAYFETAADTGAAAERRLTRAVAKGNVRLAREDESLEAQELKLRFGLTPAGELYPQFMEARGEALIARARSWVGGDMITAELAPAPPAPGAERGRFVVRTLTIDGRAALEDPRNDMAAAGQRISAEFIEQNELARAVIAGLADDFAHVQAAPYTIAGREIELEWAQRILHVDGESRLSFTAERSLRGRRRGAPTPVDVTCQEVLHIDGKKNTVHFAGQVVAASGNEELRSRTLTLLLEDLEEPSTAPAAGAAAQPPAAGAAAQAPPTAPQELLALARNLLASRGESTAPDEPFSLNLDDSRTRKEPVRLIAEDAYVQSLSAAPEDGGPPLVHSSIAAPLLEVDILQREIMTQGETTLGMISRRLPRMAPGENEPEALGLPSALISRGPSQSAMRCREAMTYVLGEEGLNRRDVVLFEGNVEFIHATGRDMVNLEDMLPQVRTNPELVTNLHSRRTTLSCDRLECGFLSEGADESSPGGGTGAAGMLSRLIAQPSAAGQVGAAGARAAGAAGATSRDDSMRLTWLLATGHVYLRDVQNGVIREIHAHQIDFDRTIGLIRILGTPEVDARIYEERPETQDSRVMAGREFVLDLNTGTVRTGATYGEVREE